MRHPGRLSAEWNILPFALAPSPAELRGHLSALRSRFGDQAACRLLGVPVQTFRGWVSGRKRIESAPARLIWLVHTILLRPDRLQTAFDLVTWGRFRVERRMVAKPDCEWTDWCI